MYLVDKVLRFVSINRYVWEINALRKALYISLVINLLFILPSFGILLSDHSYAYQGVMPTSYVSKALNLLLFTSDFQTILYLVLYLTLLVLGVFTSKYSRSIALLIYILTFILFNKINAATTGGSFLMLLVLFFNIFLTIKKNNSEYSLLISNFMFWAIRFQVVFMYLFSGWFKLSGEYWGSGNALEAILLDPTYSTPFFASFLLSSKVITVIGTYFALAYQLLFPILVWVKQLKKPLLFAGILFHLFILIVVGIPDFAIFVVATYFAFFKKEDLSCLESYKEKVIKLILPTK